MRNPQATLIRQGVTAIGRGLLEDALAQEGRKGCSPVFCTEPVSLEPNYEPFDGTVILRNVSRSQCPTAPERPGEEALSASRPDPAPQVAQHPLRTLRIFAAPEDLLTIGWMDTLLQAVAAQENRFAFELAGTQGRVAVRFGIAQDRTDVFTVSLQGLFPAVRIVREEHPFPGGAPTAVEELVAVPPYHRTQTLLGRDGASPLGIVVAAIAGLGAGDFGLYQVVLQPADPGHDWHYNVENLIEAERRATELALLGGLSTDFSYDRRMPHLREPSATEKVRRDVAFFACVARYAVWTSSAGRGDTFIQSLRSAANTVRFGNRSFRQLGNESIQKAIGAEGVQRMIEERLSHRPGLMVTSEEAATLVHLPNARTLEMFGEIEQRHGLEWSGPELSEKQGSTLGVNSFSGLERTVAITHSERLQHQYFVGVTGTGKSNLMKTSALDDAAAGRGLAVIDPHGDLAIDILSRIPEGRMDDLVYVSFGEAGLVPRWNPFRSKVPSGKLADDITRAFAASTTTFGPRMEHNFRLLTFVVHRLGGTLEDLAEIAGKTTRGEELRIKALGEVSIPEVQRFLRDELPSYRAAELDSVRNKLSRLLLDESLGAMFRQGENTLDPREWMDTGRIVLLNLASGRIGADHARFAGGLLVSLIHRAALSRADRAENQRRPFFLYLDEFQLLQSATLEEILSEGRKYGLGAILAHQEGGQLSADLVQALGNCGTRVVFRPSPEDASRLRKALLGRVTDADLLILGTGEAYVASRDRVGSLRTALCPYPVLRDGRLAAAEYAQHHYRRIEEETEPQAKAPRRKRTFDSLKKGEET